MNRLFAELVMGRLAESIGREVVIGLITVAVIGASAAFYFVDRPLLRIVLPIAAVLYSTVRIVLVSVRVRRCSTRRDQ
ncbi:MULTISPECIES: hypothetical protein [Actinoalloteichus]|uniref:Uncharacterized protein n=1 Tax=Actinoalloteichus fjordicus TaxID=1612552 RepID=A0AAC9LA96_9PSEU|nr:MULTISPECIES: hypothetical protein [Actinoalloteichus]APU12659.1 hypothetical protein UA74_02880 [Actinoalloteichus fjordicus]APU18629.1 hypothetical protein UA75_02970 [Actinoalloteichus sp. GBA129-24]